jgi:hypothetical protein
MVHGETDPSSISGWRGTSDAMQFACGNRVLWV